MTEIKSDEVSGEGGRPRGIWHPSTEDDRSALRHKGIETGESSIFVRDYGKSGVQREAERVAHQAKTAEAARVAHDAEVAARPVGSGILRPFRQALLSVGDVYWAIRHR